MTTDGNLRQLESTLTLEKLLQVSIRRNYSPAVFYKLYKDFGHKQEYTRGEKLDPTPLYRGCDKHYLQREYIYEILVGSDLQNTHEELINYFVNISKGLPINDQVCLLLFINQFPEKFRWNLYSRSKLVLNALSQYGYHLMKNFNPNDAENVKLINCFVKLITYLVVNYEERNLEKEFDKFISVLLEWLRSNSLNSLQTLREGIETYNQSALNLAFPLKANGETLKPSKSGNSLVRINERETTRLLKLKKIIWLSQAITVEFTRLDENFVNNFKQLLSLSGMPTLDVIPTLITELFSGVFDGFQLSSAKTRHIWRTYIVFKIPFFLKNVLKIGQGVLEKQLSLLFSDHSGFVLKFNDMLLQLEESLTQLGLLKRNILRLNRTSRIESETTMSATDLNHSFTQKFMECNPEFVSMKEAGIKEFILEISSSIQIVHKFCELVLESMNTFIMTGDTLRLRRLLLSCAIDLDVLDALVLFDSPFHIITPLLKFLDNNVLQIPDSSNMSTAQKYLNETNQPEFMMDVDGVNDDSSNTQDNFSDICATLNFVQFSYKRYNIIMNDDKLVQSIPNILSLLRNSKIIYDTKSQSGSTLKEVSVSDDIIDKWISSMFDPTNSEGISDDLIKMTNIYQYSQLVPRIVHEAILCTHNGWLTEDALASGLEYLQQNFLIGWLPYVIDDICDTTSDKDGKDTILLGTVLRQLLNVESTNSEEIHITIKLVKTIVNDKVWGRFEALRDLFTQPEVPLTNNEYFLNLTRYVETYDDLDTVQCVFDLPVVWNRLLKTSLATDVLFKELCSLTARRASNTEIDYDLIAILLTTFSKWIVGEKISTTWPAVLSKLNDPSISPSDVFTPILQKRSREVIVRSYNNSSNSNSAVKANTTESGFFGFIQDPNINAMEVDIKEENENHIIDPYGENLVVLAYENKGNKITDVFLRKIMQQLK